MTNQDKIVLLREEISDLGRLIESDMRLIEKYPDDFVLALTKLQYEKRKEDLETKLKMAILEDETAVMNLFTRKIQPKANYSSKIKATVNA